MIQFFRKIRRSLLSENKVSKYLLYAIGEIILVVIGILIALQINNWNEDRKTRKEERTLLISLQNEMAYNIKELARARKVNNANIKGTGRLIAHMSPRPNDQLSEKELALLLAASLQEKTEFEPRLSVINSGQLTIITNETLKNALLSIDAKVEHFRENEKTVTDIRWDCTQQTLKEGNFRKAADYVIDFSNWYGNTESPFENTNFELLRSRPFENKLTLYLATSLTSEVEHLKPMALDFEIIQKTLEEELEQFDE
ncbi:DUF6090 family protein [Flagellimonas sp. DF-77]|uniref:DUF6090 family protein n=1 Tax=Flagellimonas algarum TaxID=3230298 RepID=UPI0033963B42